MFVPIVRRYVLRIFAKYFFLAVFVFTSLLVMLNFVQMVNQGVLAGFSFYFLVRSLLYLLPSILASAIPLSFLLAVLLCLGQMSQDGEIMALRAGGYSFFSIFSGVLWAALACCAALFYLNNWAGPAGVRHSYVYTSTMRSRISKLDLKPRTFQQLSGWTIYSREVNPLTGRLGGVLLLRRTDRGGAPAYVTKLSAHYGRYRINPGRGLEIDLFDGEFSQNDLRDDRRLLFGAFTTYRTLMPFFPEGWRPRPANHRELATPELLRRLAAGAVDPELAGKFRTEAASRPALALAPLVFFLIGAPLGVALDKRGRSSGFAVSLLVTFAYYGLTVTFMTMSRKNPALFPWGLFVPALLAAGAGGLLWRSRLAGR